MESDSTMFYSQKPSKSPHTSADPELVELVAKVNFPTKFGLFELYGFSEGGSEKVHTVMVKGEVAGSTECPVRVHSECHTGDVLGSLRCDCGDQLEASLKYIALQGQGALIYLKQEGRGIGLLSKLKAYSLQDEGLDTVEANEFLGFPAEARDYTAGAAIIRALGIKSVVLLTNNPDKVEKLTQAGIKIARREPVVIEPNQHNSFYMETKKLRMGHLY
ncbi:MAG TPA: GTP cyclohydrolase II [Clostridia bacterium]|nr:GTP cyclohydrolase II [Clostridia bacterium]